MRINEIILDQHGVIILLIQKALFSLNVNSLFYLELKTSGGVIHYELVFNLIFHPSSFL